MYIANGPSVCHIDLTAIAHNFKLLGPPEKLLPIIKADAYGHGLAEVAQILDKGGACRFGVGTVSEAAILRAFGHKQEILLLLGCLNTGDWDQAVALDLMPLVGSFEDLELARKALERQKNKKLKLAVKVDTGMGRLGFNPGDIGQVRDFLLQNRGLQPRLLVSHLACADMPEEADFTAAQRVAFAGCYDALRPDFPDIECSLGNSAAIIDKPSADIGRPGLALYGGNPLPGVDDPGLKWAMSLCAPIIHIRELKPGQSVSYGRTFTAPASMRVGIVACGYANGYARALSNKAAMLVQGRRARQVGTICMSMSIIDLTDHPDVKTGEKAWLIGGEAEPGFAPVTPEEIAGLTGTIPYEVMCQIGDLNQRAFRS